MREIDCKKITAAVKELVEKALHTVEPETLKKIAEAKTSETGAARWALEMIEQNAAEAEKTDCFPCQDCGIAMIFADIGQDAHIVGGDFNEAVNVGVKQGYKTARKSVAHPLTRLNTGDNTPAVINTRITSGDNIKITFLAKGAGSENMSAVKMLTPSKGREGIIKAVTDIVAAAGANPCPPIILGIGIGGTMDKAAELSKRALLRKTGEKSWDSEVAGLEDDILRAVNALNIGAQGFGGKTTALAAAVEIFPTHIGMLPVAVTIQCHSVRHASAVL